MSSTNRGASRENLDFYPTPAWAIDLLLSRLGVGHGWQCLEPAAGDGAIVKRLLASGVRREHIAATEIDPARAEMVRQIVPDVRCEDFLKTPAPGTQWTGVYNLIITNPPFALAEEFARKMITMIGTLGYAALFLRLNWLGGQERARFHRAYPSDIYLLSKRPEFCASMSCSAKKQGCMYRETVPIEAPRPRTCSLCGAKTVCSTTDSIEYAWFVWGPGCGGRWFLLPMPER